MPGRRRGITPGNEPVSQSDANQRDVSLEERPTIAAAVLAGAS